MSKQLLSQSEAVAYLRDKHDLAVAERTLIKKRCTGGGPAFRKFGRVALYEPRALDDWVARMLSPPLRSTGVAA
jgi:hypothetical protein